MKVVTVRDFRDRASEMFHSDDVILVTRDGAPAGFYLPWNTPALPVEVRREVSSASPNRSARSSRPKAHPSKRSSTIWGPPVDLGGESSVRKVEWTPPQQR